MACDFWTYESIKTKIVEQKISPYDLDSLKQDFAGEIGSKRRMSCIKNLGDLLEILEKRDVINPANVGVLEEICHFLRNKRLIDAIVRYKPEKLYYTENEYALERIQNYVQEEVRDETPRRGRLTATGLFKEDHKTPPNSSAAPLTLILSSKKRDKVFELIATEIGKKWRDFGREIKIREGEMDSLEADYPHCKTKVRKMLELFEEDERVDPKKMVSCICTGLINCRRKDLMNAIQDILTR